MYLRWKNWEPLVLLFLQGELNLNEAKKQLDVKEFEYDYFISFIDQYLLSIKGTEYNALISLLAAFSAEKKEITRLRYRRSWQKVLAARRLGQIKSKRAIPFLLVFLKKEFPALQFACARALARIGYMEAAQEVIFVLTSPADWNKAKTAEVLLDFGREIAPEIAKALVEGEFPNDRKAFFVDLLADMEYRQSGQAVLEIAQKTNDKEIKAACIKALGEFNYFEARPFLIDCLSDSDWVIRCLAAKSLGKIGDSRDVQNLASGVRDSEWWVKYNSAVALANLGKKGVEALKKIAASDPDNFARQIANQVIEEKQVS